MDVDAPLNELLVEDNPGDVLVPQELKADPGLRRIPVAMTSSDANDDVVAAYSNHANAYLLKGFDFSRLEELVQEPVVYWLTRVVSPDA